MEEDSEPALHRAVERNDVEALTKLLQAGEDPNTRGFRDSTPLHVAVRDMHFECAKVLLEYGADPNATSKLGASPFCWGMAIKVLDRFTGKILPRTTPINIEVLRLLVESGADILTKHKGLIHTAAGSQQNEGIAIVKFLIEHGHDPSARDKWNKTPLGWAADHGSPEMVQFLIDQKCPLYALTISLETALCRAVRRAPDWENVNILLKEHHKQQGIIRNLKEVTNESNSVEEDESNKNRDQQNASIQSTNDLDSAIIDILDNQSTESLEKSLNSRCSAAVTTTEDLSFIDDSDNEVDALLAKKSYTKVQRSSSPLTFENPNNSLSTSAVITSHSTDSKNDITHYEPPKRNISLTCSSEKSNISGLPPKIPVNSHPISEIPDIETGTFQSLNKMQSLSKTPSNSLLKPRVSHSSTSLEERSRNVISETQAKQQNFVSLPVSLLSEEDRFHALIHQEKSYHSTDQDIRLCLRKGLGPNSTTNSIIKAMAEMKKKGAEKPPENKCITSLKNHIPKRLLRWKQYMAQKFSYLKQKLLPPIKKAVPFLSGVVFCWVSYYADFGMDILLAIRRLSEKLETAALVLTWLFAFIPSIVLNIRLCYERSSFAEFEVDDVYKNHGFFKHFLVFYENKVAAIIACILQGWPALVYLQNYHVNELPIHIIPNNILVDHKENLKRRVRLVRQWEALLEATPQLFLQLWITMRNQQILTTAITLKLAMSIFSISFNLLKEEMIAKQVELPALGKICLLLNFYLRTIARTISIVLFTCVLSYWIAMFYIFHVIIVLGIQVQEFRKQNPEAVGWPTVRFTEAFSSIFNYIASKNYEANIPTYSRLSFLTLTFLEDAIMLSLTYLFLSEPLYSPDFIFYCIGVYFGSILISFSLLLLYYKAFHPWSWNVELFRPFRSKMNSMKL